MTKPAEGIAAPTAEVASGLAGAAERLRQSARWSVVTFGAVAAVVFAGISISSFGTLDADTKTPQFVAALLGAGAAIVGTLVALLTAMTLAAASTMSLADLTKSVSASLPLGRAQAAVDTSPLLAPWDGKRQDFVAAIEQANVKYRTELEAWRDDDSMQASTVQVDRAATYHEYLASIEQAVLQTASYVRLHARFRVSKWIFGPALLLATAGGVLFVWATGSPATEHVPTVATAAQWAVPGDERDDVDKQLGVACNYPLDEVPVVIVGTQTDAKELEIVTDPDGGCAPLRLVVNRADVSRVP